MLEPNHALKELEMRYAISSSVKAPLALRFERKGRSERKQGRDSRFFAAKEVSLSAEGGDSPREQEKSRISVMKATQKF